MKLIDADTLRQAILSTMPERSEVLLLVDNQPEVVTGSADVEKVKQGLFRCFMKCNEPFAIGCGQCPYVGMCYPSANEYESPETAALYTDTIALIDEMQAEIERLKAVINHEPDCANAEHDGGGCLGYSGSHDDEPIESCKKCEKYTGNTAKDGDGK